MKPGAQILLTCPFAWEEHEMPVDYARYSQFALKDMLEKNGFNLVLIDKNGHFMSALHQLFVLYIHDHWMHQVPVLSKFNLFKKLVRQIGIPLMNMGFSLVESFWPKSDRFYLNTIVIAEKMAKPN
jgi:hypothetical protein